MSFGKLPGIFSGAEHCSSVTSGSPIESTDPLLVDGSLGGAAASGHTGGVVRVRSAQRPPSLQRYRPPGLDAKPKRARMGHSFLRGKMTAKLTHECRKVSEGRLEWWQMMPEPRRLLPLQGDEVVKPVLRKFG